MKMCEEYVDDGRTARFNQLITQRGYPGPCIENDKVIAVLNTVTGCVTPVFQKGFPTGGKTSPGSMYSELLHSAAN